jgi:hypothetical protein
LASPEKDLDWSIIEGGRSPETWLIFNKLKKEAGFIFIELIQTLKADLPQYKDELDWTEVIPQDFKLDTVEYPKLLFAHPKILTSFPDSVEWYISVAGLSLKTLRNLGEDYKKSGGTKNPDTIRTNLTKGNGIEYKELLAFSKWLNNIIAETFDGEHIGADDLALQAALTFGGRVVGKCQNISGDMTVVRVKMLLYKCPKVYSNIKTLEVGSEQGTEQGTEQGNKQVDFDPEIFIEKIGRIKKIILKSGTEIAFPVGGNVPDIAIISKEGKYVMVGEIKGRMDTSNAWESWVPQIGGHLRSWKIEYPDATKIVFGTLFTVGMIDGTSRETPREGLKDYYNEKLLDLVFNISVTEKNAQCRAAFCERISELLEIAEEGGSP